MQACLDKIVPRLDKTWHEIPMLGVGFYGWLTREQHMALNFTQHTNFGLDLLKHGCKDLGECLHRFRESSWGSKSAQYFRPRGVKKVGFYKTQML